LNFLLKEKHFSALNRRLKKFIKILESRKEIGEKSVKKNSVCVKKKSEKEEESKVYKRSPFFSLSKNSHSKKVG